MRFMAVILLVIPTVVQTALAQHAGGFARGNAGGRGFAGRGMMTRPPTRGLGGRRRSPFIGSYLPIPGSYGLLGDYPYDAGYPYPGLYAEEPPPPPPNAFVTAPPAGQASPQPAAAVKPAQSVIHEYTWPKNGESGESRAGATTFTIALKDGSQRFATAAWIQGGKLHYLDSEDRQQALSSDVIDRQTTDRLNEEKHLRLQLPPG
jgi:hypothetical protein